MNSYLIHRLDRDVSMNERKVDKPQCTKKKETLRRQTEAHTHLYLWLKRIMIKVGVLKTDVIVNKCRIAQSGNEHKNENTVLQDSSEYE